MKQILISSTLLLLISCNQTRSDESTKIDVIQPRLEGVYHYKYPDNTSDLIEDHYLVFESNGAVAEGRYYGTTDEFEESREGYLPGFFVADIKNLRRNSDTLVFNIHLDTNDVFTSAVPLTIKSAEQGRKDGLRKWDLAQYLDLKKSYSGILRGDSIFFKGNISLFDKCFKRTDR